MSSHPLFLYLHIPKTAGNAFKYSVLREVFSQDCVFEVADGETLEQIKSLTEEELAKYHVIQGHFRYGLHKSFSRPCIYSVVLREPVERTLSNYYYAAQFPDNEIHKQLAAGADFKSLFHLAGPNLQVLYLCSNPEAPIDVQLEEAKHNLKNNIELIGLSSRLEETALLHHIRFGWPIDTTIKRLNVTKRKNSQKELSAAEFQLVREACKYDIELYKFAEELFEERLRAVLPEQVALFLATQALRQLQAGDKHQAFALCERSERYHASAEAARLKELCA